VTQPRQTVIRPEPADTSRPTNAPAWHTERVRAENEWTRQVQVAMNDLQKRIAALEAENAALKNG